SPQAEQPLWEALSRNGAEFGISEALSKATGWTLTPEKIDRLAAACPTEDCRHQAEAMRRWLAEPISISVDDLPNTWARVGLFLLRDRAQFEQKIAQFPKGTTFLASGQQRRDEIRRILEAAGMRLVDRP